MNSFYYTMKISNELCCINCIFLGLLLSQGSRFKLTYDGHMHYMEIPRCREYDAGQLRVVAKNSEGEEECTTKLTVLPKEDWRAKLKQAPKGIFLVTLLPVK